MFNCIISFIKDAEYKLFLKKNVFPYAWLNHFKKLNINQTLSKEDFYNDMTKDHVSDEE